jgi:hypothetical protein
MFHPQTRVFLGWTLFVIFIVACFVEPYRALLKGFVYNERYAGFHSSFAPTLFCSAIAWLIFVTENGPRSIERSENIPELLLQIS